MTETIITISGVTEEARKDIALLAAKHTLTVNWASTPDSPEMAALKRMRPDVVGNTYDLTGLIPRMNGPIEIVGYMSQNFKYPVIYRYKHTRGGARYKGTRNILTFCTPDNEVGLILKRKEERRIAETKTAAIASTVDARVAEEKAAFYAVENDAPSYF
jgi:hypothetical protein